MSFSLGRRCPPGPMRGGGSVLIWPSPTVCDVNPLPKDEGYVGWWILRLRLRLRLEWQDGYWNEWKLFGLEKPNNRVSSTLRLFYWFFEHWFCLMLCSLFFIEAKCSSFFWLLQKPKKRMNSSLMIMIWKNVNSGRTVFWFYKSLQKGIWPNGFESSRWGNPK